MTEETIILYLVVGALITLLIYLRCDNFAREVEYDFEEKPLDFAWKLFLFIVLWPAIVSILFLGALKSLRKINNRMKNHD